MALCGSAGGVRRRTAVHHKSSVAAGGHGGVRACPPFACQRAPRARHPALRIFQYAHCQPVGLGLGRPRPGGGQTFQLANPAAMQTWPCRIDDAQCSSCEWSRRHATRGVGSSAGRVLQSCPLSCRVLWPPHQCALPVRSRSEPPLETVSERSSVHKFAPLSARILGSNSKASAMRRITVHGRALALLLPLTLTSAAGPTHSPSQFFYDEEARNTV